MLSLCANCILEIQLQDKCHLLVWGSNKKSTAGSTRRVGRGQLSRRKQKREQVEESARMGLSSVFTLGAECGAPVFGQRL